MMLNFTVGPVMSSNEVKRIGAEDVPYFRTPEFSKVMLENERIMKKFASAPESARVVFLTGSGTASMEAAVMNCFTPKDKVLIVNGGSFGQRFVELCKIHKIPYSEIKPEFGKGITEKDLEIYNSADYTGFLVNLHETSTGVKYDLDMISNFCRKNHLFLVVDAISSFLADPIDMKKSCIDVMITGSQKALACPPGISILVLSQRAIERIMVNEVPSMYLDLKAALNNGERGQTPFSPAVGIVLQIHERLSQIDKAGGVESETIRISNLAADFRQKVKDLPFEIVSDSLSNAVTPLHPTTSSAYKIFEILKDEYNIWVCPNGGDLSQKVFRVGHIGELTKDHNTILIDALYDLQKRGII